MAVATFRAEKVFMHVVFLVARVTRGGSVPVLGFRFVAGVTLGIEVFAGKNEIGQLVVEAGLVQTNDVGVPAFMIRMAVSARPPIGASIFTVKTETVIYVSGDIFVAIEAQRSLLRPLERLVTGITVFFEFGMPFDDFAGHHQGFNLG